MVYTMFIHMFIPPIYGKHIWMVYDCVTHTLQEELFSNQKMNSSKKVNRKLMMLKLAQSSPGFDNVDTAAAVYSI